MSKIGSRSYVKSQNDPELLAHFVIGANKQIRNGLAFH